MDKLVCDLTTGKWGPKKGTDSCQTTIAQLEQGKSQLEPNRYSQKEREQVRSAVREKYTEVSSSAEGLFKYTTGQEGARVLGYAEEILKDIPADLLNSFCGVGNPFSLGEIEIMMAANGPVLYCQEILQTSIVICVFLSIYLDHQMNTLFWPWQIPVWFPLFEYENNKLKVITFRQDMRKQKTGRKTQPFLAWSFVCFLFLGKKIQWKFFKWHHGNETCM